MEALIKAPEDKVAPFIESIEKLYLSDYKARPRVLKELILPAISNPGSYFGAEFLHKLLINQPNAFAREKVWLGWDSYSISTLENGENDTYPRYNMQLVLNSNGLDDELALSSYALHNELPLVYGWALATLDQNFRHRLRVSLTGWALVQPMEFILLLDKLFVCNDPQIKEDLASIMLGLASRLEDAGAIHKLTLWSLQHVFEDIGHNRNIIVRHGFRCIVERAFDMGLISIEQVEKARPHRLPSFGKPLPLDQKVLENPMEEIYPIVHDLAWYVLKRAYEDFYSYSYSDLGESFLKAQVSSEAEVPSPRSWAMAVSIAYIKSLGFDREKGNGFTNATHGSKSEFFTLEEKYTWLAVHYMKGYLSDYLPLAEGNDLEDYNEIIDVPNPAEYLPIKEKLQLLNEWVIAEPLVNELADVSDVDNAIEQNVFKEPAIDFEKWIYFSSREFSEGIPEKTLFALYNFTTLRDSRSYISTRMDIRACIIKKGTAGELQNLLLKKSGKRYLGRDIDYMHADPKTGLYSNPTDIVWMHWIGENNSCINYSGIIYDEDEDDEDEKIYYGITELTSTSVDGEQHIFLPSKFVRERLGISEMQGTVLRNKAEEVMGILHTIKDLDYDRQDMVLVDSAELVNQLDKSNLEIVWFAQVLSSKNPHNDTIRNDSYPQKCRKYFIRMDNMRFRVAKYWDARFSNKQDDE